MNMLKLSAKEITELQPAAALKAYEYGVVIGGIKAVGDFTFDALTAQATEYFGPAAKIDSARVRARSGIEYYIVVLEAV